MTAPVSVAEAIDTLNTNISVESPATATTSGVQNPKEMSTSRAVPSQRVDETTIIVNPLLNEFVDCIENLPSRLQLLLSELRNIDAQVNSKWTTFGSLVIYL
jgi:hypothetical protein